MIDWKLASSAWDKEEYLALIRQISTDQFSMSDKVISLENEFALWNKSKYCVMVNSGSSANLLMIASLFYTTDDTLRLQAGDEVIVPAVSWSTTYYPLQQYGLKLVFVDVDENTFNLDPVEVESAITDKTRAIFAVNLLGNPCEFSSLRGLCDSHNLILLEDNCESLGCVYDQKFGGTIGLMGSHSSYFSHHFSTMEGGYVTTDNEELYHILLSLRSHGWTRNLPDRNLVSGMKSKNPFEETFKFVLPGYNVRPLELSAAVGLTQMKKLDNFLTIRRANACHFLNVFSEFENITIQREVGSSSSFGFGIVLNNTLDRNTVLNFLDVQGVEYRPIVAGNFTKNPVLKYMNHRIHGQLKNANKIDKSGFFIGNHHYDLKFKIDELGMKMRGIL